MKSSKSNSELLIQLQKGDRVAFYILYERYCKRLYGFVLRYIKIEADAEEVVQEVFIKIWESREKLNAYSSFESYLFTITYNAAISLFRKKVCEQKYLDHLKSIQQIQEAPDLIDELHYNELNDKLKNLLNRITPRQKEIFQLSREQGLSHDEIAKKLNITKNTVKKHMVNTLAFLKSNLGNDVVVVILFNALFL